MPYIRHLSPLPADPPQTGGSPMPGKSVFTVTGSPLPPDPALAAAA